MYSFRVFLYDYLKKRGFSQTAKTLRNEAQITARTSSRMYIFLVSSFIQLPYNIRLCDYAVNTATYILLLYFLSFLFLFISVTLCSYLIVFSEFNRPYDPYGFLYEFWVSFYDLYQAWIIPGLSRKSDQVLMA